MLAAVLRHVDYLKSSVMPEFALLSLSHSEMPALFELLGQVSRAFNGQVVRIPE